MFLRGDFVRVNGGVIGSYNQTTNRQARGVWGAQEMDALKRGFRFPRFYEGWDLTSLYNSQPIYNSTNVSPSVGTLAGANAPSGMAFKSDGTKVYLIDSSTDVVYEFDLSTAWDLTTMSYNSVSFSIFSQDGTPSGMFMSSDGYSLYMLGVSTDFVYQYPLSTAWDLSTASTEGIKSLDVNPPEGAPGDLHFSPDGYNLYIVGTALDGIHSYTLSTAWDISTATYNNQSTSLLGYEGTLTGMAMSADGTKVFLTGSGNDNIYQFALSTAWDVSTLETPAKAAIDINPPEVTPTGICFDSSGSRLFFTGSGSDKIHSYDLGTLYDITIPGWESSIYLSLPNNPSSTKWKPDGTKIFVYAFNDTAITSYSLSTAWDLSTATADGVSLSTVATVPTMMALSDDGTIVFSSGSAGNITKFDLSTPWDFSTAGTESSTLLTISNIRDIQFFDSGTTMFVLTSTTVQKYTLSSAFDLTTASLDSTWSSTFDTALGITGAYYNFYISPEGSKLFVGDTGDDNVYQLDMTTSFDISTLTYNGIYLSVKYNFPAVSTGPGPQLRGGLTFKSDGKIMYLVDWDVDNLYPIYLSSV